MTVASQATLDAKRREAAIVINSFAVAHGVVAFLLANTLIGDTVILTGLTIAMIVWIAGIYGVEMDNPEHVLEAILKVSAGPVGVYVAAKLIFWLPGIGNAANAATTVAITEIIGWTCVTLFSSGRTTDQVSHDELKSIVKKARSVAEENKKERAMILSVANGSEKSRIAELSSLMAESGTSEQERKTALNEITKIYDTLKVRAGIAEHATA